MKPILYLALCCLSITGSYAPAQAADPNIRKAENCFKVGWLSEKLSKLTKLKPNKTDIVGVSPTAHVKLDDRSQPYPRHHPKRYFIKDRGVETDLPIAPDGQLLGFEKLSGSSKDVELCHYDPKRAGLPFDADGISLDINTDIQFHNQSGTHSLDEIKDGLKDGKSHYKKTAGAMAMFVPKMSHIMIKYDDETQPLEFTALKDDVPLTAPVQIVYCVLPMIRVKDLERIGADRIRISGGPYRLLPVPGLAAMKRFEGCGEDEG